MSSLVRRCTSSLAFMDVPSVMHRRMIDCRMPRILTQEPPSSESPLSRRRGNDHVGWLESGHLSVGKRPVHGPFILPIRLAYHGIHRRRCPRAIPERTHASTQHRPQPPVRHPRPPDGLHHARRPDRRDERLGPGEAPAARRDPRRAGRPRPRATGPCSTRWSTATSPGTAATRLASLAALSSAGGHRRRPPPLDRRPRRPRLARLRPRRAEPPTPTPPGPPIPPDLPRPASASARSATTPRAASASSSSPATRS